MKYFQGVIKIMNVPIIFFLLKNDTDIPTYHKDIQNHIVQYYQDLFNGALCYPIQ